MARFRFHRGNLKESKATEIKIDSLKELEEVANAAYKGVFQVKDLACHYYGMDSRPQGYPMTHIVTAIHLPDGIRYPLGFSDEFLTY